MQSLRGGCGRRGRGLGEGQRAQAQSPELQEEPEPQREANRAESPAEPTGEVPDAGGAGWAAPEAAGGSSQIPPGQAVQVPRAEAWEADGRRQGTFQNQQLMNRAP